MNTSLLPQLSIIAMTYLVGSIPFGLLLTKLFGLGDIRQIGSGNIGATNVLRTGNKILAALTLCLDFSKAVIALLLAKYFSSLTSVSASVHCLSNNCGDCFTCVNYLMMSCSLAVLLGHMFPIWLRFKGGKGVATAAGIITALAWPAGVATIVVWVGILWRTRLSSLAAITAAIFTPVNVVIFGYRDFFWNSLIIALLVIMKHKANIQRLIDKTEPKISDPQAVKTP
jgi:acyl phosphate:glycerol-3-phosphate acyltransferase